MAWLMLQMQVYLHRSPEDSESSILHTGKETEFIPNSLLMYKSETTSGDYHHKINFCNYVRWLKIKLIIKITSNLALVVYNAAYRNVQLNPVPNSVSRKTATIDWVSDRSITFSDRMCKLSLFFLIKLRNPRFETFIIDALLAERGHSDLRLPPYHPGLNPTKPMWGSVKEHYARNNVSLRFDNARQFEWNYLRLEHTSIIKDTA
jgi:hypothetical protein